MSELPVWLYNLSMFTIQMLLVVAVSGLVAHLVGFRAPRARLAYWQVVLAICFALALWQPRPKPDGKGPEYIAVRRSNTGTAHPGSAAPRPVSTGKIAAEVIAAGVAMRLLWLAIGMWSLRRYRRNARTWQSVPEAIDAARRELGIEAEFAISRQIDGPIAFGWKRPMVLFPEKVLDMPGHAQRAIAVHELLHVRRKDWLWTVAEECLLTAFWFELPVWWLVEQVRLAREQVVDAEVVRLTTSRERYVEALLAVAGFSSAALFTPAPPFLGRGQLSTRVIHLLKESTMSKRRLIIQFATGLAAAVAMSAVSVSLFPLRAQSVDAIRVEAGGDALVRRAPLEYPGQAVERKVEGLMVVEVTTDATGEVIDAHVLSGPDQLRRSVLHSVLNWKYDPSKHAAGNSQVVLRFTLPQNREAAFLPPIGPAFQPDKMFFVSRDVETPDQRAKHLAEIQEQLAKVQKMRNSPGLTEKQAAELANRAEDLAKVVQDDGMPRIQIIGQAPLNSEQALKLKMQAEELEKAIQEGKVPPPPPQQ